MQMAPDWPTLELYLTTRPRPEPPSRPDPEWVAAAERVLNRSLTPEEMWHVQHSATWANLEWKIRSWAAATEISPPMPIPVIQVPIEPPRGETRRLKPPKIRSAARSVSGLGSTLLRLTILRKGRL